MENESGVEIYIPQVADHYKPHTGQEFISEEEAFSFYNKYARESGFSVKINNSTKNKKTGEVVWKEFSCNKEGQTNDTYQKKMKQTKPRSGERNRGVVRVGCDAKMTISRKPSGQTWVVKTIKEGHNHGLTTPSRVHLLPSHREVSTAKKALTQQFSQANIPTCQQMRLMEIDYGGPENIGCTERDIRNYEQSLRDLNKEHDAETLIVFFKSEKEKNPSFFFDYEVDSEKKFTRCFWADAKSRRYYEFFGDVIVFDTTYNTNKYSMIFAPFTGVNHHGQTIIFGCGFLSDEKTESFIWLFSKFMEAMPKGPPRMIITDQDPAMAKAISQVFLLTFHRYCIWHILKKFSEKLNPLEYRDHYHIIKNAIMNSESPGEFEGKWAKLMDSTKLEDNEWLKHMYDLRHRWVPAYVKHIFSAGISSSQRAESAHSFFKKYVSIRNSLMDFIIRFNRALRKQRHNELKANHVDANEKPKLKSRWPIESQMSILYTKKRFLIIQNEIDESNAYCINLESGDEDSEIYIVRRVHQGDACRQRRLEYNKQLNLVSCSCKKFEFEGLPCRHMLVYFRVKQVFELPDMYIIHRWTKNAKVGVVTDNSGTCINEIEDVPLMTRHGKLAHIATLLVDDASLTNVGTDLILEAFENLHIKVREINNGMKADLQPPGNKIIEDRPDVNDPLKVKAKGGGKRMKSSKEKVISKERLCHGCGLRGQSHDKRNCPSLNDRSAENNTENDSQSNSDDLNDDDGDDYSFD